MLVSQKVESPTALRALTQKLQRRPSRGLPGHLQIFRLVKNICVFPVGFRIFVPLLVLEHVLVLPCWLSNQWGGLWTSASTRLCFVPKLGASAVLTNPDRWLCSVVSHFLSSWTSNFSGLDHVSMVVVGKHITFLLVVVYREIPT